MNYEKTKNPECLEQDKQLDASLELINDFVRKTNEKDSKEIIKKVVEDINDIKAEDLPF